MPPGGVHPIAYDGSLAVRFRAGGRQEMAWYLYRWGDKVEVLTLPSGQSGR